MQRNERKCNENDREWWDPAWAEGDSSKTIGSQEDIESYDPIEGEKWEGRKFD